MAFIVLTLASVFVLPFAFAQETQSQETNRPKRIAIRAGRLIDGKSDKPILNALIVVEGGRIVSVTANGTLSADDKNSSRTEVIDLSHSTVLAGID